MANEARRFRRRKREHFICEGIYVDAATTLVPDTNKSDETHHLFGNDDPEMDVQHNNGVLAVTVLDKYVNNELLDLITGQDPEAALPHKYDVDMLTSVHVWANVKNKAGTAYAKSWFLGGWSPGLPLPSGDANAKAAFQLTGNGNLPKMFEGAWISSKKVASGAAPNIGATPVVIPGESVYAVAVKAIDTTGGIFETEDVIVTADMVAVSGAVDFAEIEAQVSQLDDVTHAMVYFLQTGTGIYPAAFPATPGSLRE